MNDEADKSRADPMGAEQAHRELLAALVEGELEALDRLVSDGCEIVGPMGSRLDKAGWLDTQASEGSQQVLLEALELRVHHYKDVAVRCDLQRSERLDQGRSVSGRFRVLSVWTRTTGRWQLAAIQYTTVGSDGAALTGQGSAVA